MPTWILQVNTNELKKKKNRQRLLKILLLSHVQHVKLEASHRHTTTDYP